MNRVAVAGALAALTLIPFAATAQADLETTIRAAILQDPRSAQMSEAELSALVSALSQGAQEQGVTPQDIVWRPESEQATQNNAFCAPFPLFFCLINYSFGFAGPDYIIALWLAAASLLLIVLNAMHKHHLRVHAAASVPAANPPPGLQ